MMMITMVDDYDDARHVDDDDDDDDVNVYERGVFVMI